MLGVTKLSVVVLSVVAPTPTPPPLVTHSCLLAYSQLVIQWACFISLSLSVIYKCSSLLQLPLMGARREHMSGAPWQQLLGFCLAHHCKKITAVIHELL
jgi:hypothetical protein